MDPVVFQSSETIESTVKRGVVTLTGTTHSLSSKRKAERLASDVVGTVRVVNELEVQRPAKNISDAEIIRDVQAAIRRSPYIERREVRVHCQRAHVSIYEASHGFVQLPGVDGLAEITVTAIFKTTISIRVHRIGCERNDWLGESQFPKSNGCLIAVQSRHLHVE